MYFDLSGMAEHIRGWLLKWTNYIKGYQKRWFVLSNGLLSYYRYMHVCEQLSMHAAQCWQNMNTSWATPSLIQYTVCMCRSQEEMSHTCRGTVNLAGAFIDTIDSTNFVVTNGPQVLTNCHYFACYFTLIMKKTQCKRFGDYLSCMSFGFVLFH